MHRFRQVEAKEASKVLKEAQAPRAPGKSYLRVARFDGGLNGGDFLPMEFVEKSPKEINLSFFFVLVTLKVNNECWWFQKSEINSPVEVGSWNPIIYKVFFWSSRWCRISEPSTVSSTFCVSVFRVESHVIPLVTGNLWPHFKGDMHITPSRKISPQCAPKDTKINRNKKQIQPTINHLQKKNEKRIQPSRLVVGNLASPSGARRRVGPRQSRHFEGERSLGKGRRRFPKCQLSMG